MCQAIIVIPRNKKVVEQLIELQIRRGIFQEEIEKFRKKFNIKKLGSTATLELEKQKTEFGHVWDVYLHQMLQRLGLHRQWSLVVIEYITTGRYSIENDPEGIAIYKETDDCRAFRVDNLHIDIHMSTTKTDMINAWDSIEKYFKGHKTKERTTLNFERDEYIFVLHEEKKLPYKEIQKIISDNYREILTDSHLRSIVDKQKKKLQKHRTLYFKK